MIFLDTNIFIYHLASDSHFGENADKIFSLIEKGKIEADASVISYSEILTFPARAGKMDLIKQYAELLGHYPHLSFIDVDFKIAHEASLLRGKFPTLKLADALILATASFLKSKVFLTEDKRLKLTGLNFEILTLNNFLVKFDPKNSD